MVVVTDESFCSRSARSLRNAASLARKFEPSPSSSFFAFGGLGGGAGTGAGGSGVASLCQNHFLHIVTLAITTYLIVQSCGSISQRPLHGMPLLPSPLVELSILQHLHTSCCCRVWFEIY